MTTTRREAMTSETRMVRITGTTYPIKGYLREFGGEWNGAAWTMSADAWARLVATIGGDPDHGNKRDRERKAAVAGCEVSDVR
jgi:hypothetical protein